MKNYINLKNSKGSITLFTILSLLFFVVILSSIYISSLNSRKSQIDSIQKITDNYSVDEEKYNEIYNSIIVK